MNLQTLTKLCLVLISQNKNQPVFLFYFILFYLAFLYGFVHKHPCTPVSAAAPVWESESGLSLRHVGPRDQAPGYQAGHKPISQPKHSLYF